ncbi:MAG: Ldh family oxidoreductase [Myxococcota bacterium]
MDAFPVDRLRSWGVAIYVATGMAESDATTVIDNQLWSDLRGVDTHGFQRISWYVRWFREGRCDPKAQLRIVSESPTAMVGDGQGGLGQLVVTRFVDRLIEAAGRSGLVIGTLRNSNDWGCGANYPCRAADAGLVCFATTTSVPNLAPFGSRRRLLGNNPIVYAFPRRSDPPIVLDMALTPVALGKVLRARSEGTQIPLDWGFRDREGQPTRDPDAALAGVIPAIGGYKGIGLAVVSNLLAGVLSGSAHTGDVEVGRRGQFLLLLDPQNWIERERYFDAVEEMVAQIRASEEDALPGERVWLPGEIEQRNFEERAKRGAVVYPPSVIRSLEKTGADLGVPFDIEPVG